MQLYCRLASVFFVFLESALAQGGSTQSVTEGGIINSATTSVASPINSKTCDSCDINPATSVTIALMESPANSNSCNSCNQCNKMLPVYLGATAGVFFITTAIMFVILIIVLCKRRSHRVERKNNVFEEGVESRYWKDPMTLPSISLETTLSEEKEPSIWFSPNTTNTFKDGAEGASSRYEHRSRHQLNQKKRWYKPKRKAPLPPNVTRFKSKSGEVVYAVPNAHGTLSFYSNSHEYKELDPAKMKPPSDYAKPVQTKHEGPSVSPKPHATVHNQQ